MKPRVYIETFGCQMNVADTERAATGLRASGYDLCVSEQEADVVLLNTCSVREKAEHKVFTRIGEIRSANEGHKKLIGVMGCVAQLQGVLGHGGERYGFGSARCRTSAKAAAQSA